MERGQPDELVELVEFTEIELAPDYALLGVDEERHRAFELVLAVPFFELHKVPVERALLVVIAYLYGHAHPLHLTIRSHAISGWSIDIDPFKSGEFKQAPDVGFSVIGGYVHNTQLTRFAQGEFFGE
jgi:hypothetical protein